MIEENLQDFQIPKQKMISMIEEFIGCLNYPKTKAMLEFEKKKINKQQSIVQKQQSQQKAEERQNAQQFYEREKQLQMKQQKQKVDNVEQNKQRNGQIDVEIANQNGRHQIKIQNSNQIGWKRQQTKYYSNFATFAEIVYCLETSLQGKQNSLSKIKQKSDEIQNSEILQNRSKQKPALLNIFSAFDTIAKLKKFIVPVYRNFCIQPKFSKPTKLMQASPKNPYLVIIDEQSTMILVHLKQKIILQFQRTQQKQQINCLRWLNHNNNFVVGTGNGKIIVWNVCKDKQLNKLHTLTPHIIYGSQKSNLNEIVSIYSTKDYLYTCCSDYTIAKTYIKTWKTQHITYLKGKWYKKMTKIQHKKLKDIIFGIDQYGSEIQMIDQITGLSSTVFSIADHHVEECRKVWMNSKQIFKPKQIKKISWIQQILTNHDNNTLIVSVAGLNPSIYQVNPFHNQVVLRFNHQNFKHQQLSIQNYYRNHQIQLTNIHITLSHKSQLLIVTTNSKLIFYIRIKNWRIIHQYRQVENGIKFGQLSATTRYHDIQQSTQRKMEMIQKQPESTHNGKVEQHLQAQKSSILCVCNAQNGNIQVYESQKLKLKIIRNDIQRAARSFLVSGARFPVNAQGFLELLQTIRQNYQAFV